MISGASSLASSELVGLAGDRLGERRGRLERGQGASRVARGEPHERVARLGLQRDAAAESARIGDRAIDEHAEVVVGERLAA